MSERMYSKICCFKLCQRNAPVYRRGIYDNLEALIFGHTLCKHLYCNSFLWRSHQYDPV